MIEKPELKPIQSQAWDLLEQNYSLAKTGEIVGRSKGTVSGWVGKWRRDYGDDLFRPPSHQSADDGEPTWANNRDQEALNLGISASAVRNAMHELLPAVGRSRVDRGADGTGAPIILPGVPASDVRALAEAAAKLIETAESLTQGSSQRRRVG